MKENISIRLDEDLVQQARDAAEKENRTLSNWIEWVVRKFFADQK